LSSCERGYKRANLRVDGTKRDVRVYRENYRRKLFGFRVLTFHKKKDIARFQTDAIKFSGKQKIIRHRYVPQFNYPNNVPLRPPVLK
jgi:hypothetical protein